MAELSEEQQLLYDIGEQLAEEVERGNIDPEEATIIIVASWR